MEVSSGDREVKEGAAGVKRPGRRLGVCSRRHSGMVGGGCCPVGGGPRGSGWEPEPVGRAGQRVWGAGAAGPGPAGPAFR